MTAADRSTRLARRAGAPIGVAAVVISFAAGLGWNATPVHAQVPAATAATVTPAADTSARLAASSNPSTAATDAGAPARMATAPTLSVGDSGTPAAAVSGTPILQSLSATELAGLRPLAARGIGILIRDAGTGARARTTVVVRVRAPLATVMGVIATPEQYPAFMGTSAVGGMEILSRRGARTAYRFTTAMAIFNVTTLAMNTQVNESRMDSRIVQTQLGPGASRWDLYPDGDGTLIAYSAWSDPTQGSWFLRIIANQSRDAIGGMLVASNALLALATGRRAEMLNGRRVPNRPVARTAPVGALEPPEADWASISHNTVVGSVALNDDGVMTQSTIAMWVRSPPEAVFSRLEDVAHYNRYWNSIRDLRVVSGTGDSVRFATSVNSDFFSTSGEQDRVLERGPLGRIVWWRGVSGDYAADVQRWDVRADPSGGTVVLFTGGSEQNRAGMMARQILNQDVWLAPGYSIAWKIVWMPPLLAGL